MLQLQNWSKLGLGTGNLASFGRSVSVKDVKKILDAMQLCGANLIDTADTYGSGDCEILIRKALDGRRSCFQLITKAGYSLSNLKGPLRPLNQFVKKGICRLVSKTNFSPCYLQKSLDESLKRLGTESVDAFLLHDATYEAVSNDEILDMMIRLKKSGKTSLIGFSSDLPRVVLKGVSSKVFDVIQTPANLTAAMQFRDIWRACENQGIRLVANHVFAPQSLAVTDMNRELVMRTCAALVPASASILCGTRNPNHFIETSSWVNNPLQTNAAIEIASSCIKRLES